MTAPCTEDGSGGPSGWVVLGTGESARAEPVPQQVRLSEAKTRCPGGHEAPDLEARHGWRPESAPPEGG